jgi:hypothetical protein
MGQKEKKREEERRRESKVLSGFYSVSAVRL